MVFSLLYHLSLSHKHRLKTLQIGLNLSSYLRLKEGKKVVAIEVNIGEKKKSKRRRVLQSSIIRSGVEQTP